MKSRLVLCLLIVVAMTSYVAISAQQPGVPLTRLSAAGDTMYVTGGTIAGDVLGSLETAINGDTTAGVGRTNPNRVYALYQGQYYFQIAPIIFNGPTGKLTICGVPSGSGTTKPVIIIAPQSSNPVSTNAGATVNIVYGSVKMDGVHYQAMQTSGVTTNELFQCGTSGTRAQSLEINNCLFEFSNIDLFDCTNEQGAIGGWPYGAKFRITNSYFRDLFYSAQWWDSRVFQCKHPIDTLWVENVTVTGGGLTFLQQNQLTDFMYINHNTILNNKKYWVLSPYHKTMFITNNIFVNQNWVGEDANVTNSGQDPDRLYMSTINVDTNNATNGLIVQGKYYQGDSSHFVSALDLNKLQIYVSDNVNFWDPRLISGYYNSSTYKLGSLNALPSYLTWSSSDTPRVIGNVPGEWMNSRTRAFFAAYAPPNGGFIEMRTDTTDPGMTTPAIANAAVIDSMARWNQNLWGDRRFAGGAALQRTAYDFGDYDPTTIPGNKTENGAGIVKFTDLTENFAQSTHMSAIDSKPIGALIWDDAALAAFNSDADFQAVYNKYVAEGGLVSVGGNPSVPMKFSLAQNYPNPFNPSTRIQFSISKQANVELKVYNVLGQVVATLINGTMTAGQHEITFDARNLASGIYFYRLTAGDLSSVKKMVLLK